MNDLFEKSIPIRFTGDLANAARAGCGTVVLLHEVIVPLVSFKDAVIAPIGGGIKFWPMLTEHGIKWLYAYSGNSKFVSGRFSDLSEVTPPK